MDYKVGQKVRIIEEDFTLYTGCVGTVLKNEEGEYYVKLKSGDLKFNDGPYHKNELEPVKVPYNKIAEKIYSGRIFEIKEGWIYL